MKEVNSSSICSHLVVVPGGPGLSPSTTKEIGKLCPEFPQSDFWAPGTGRSSEPIFSKLRTHEENYLTVLQTAKEDLRSQYGNKRFCFIGHSFGGKVAIDLARALTAQTSVIIVIASPFSAKLERALIESVERHGGEEFRKVRRKYYRDPTRQTYQAFSSQYAAWCSLQSGTQAKIRKMLEDDESAPLATAMCNKREECDPSLEHDIQKLSCKKVGIFGIDDQLVDINLAESECERLGFQFFGIANAGHFPFLENPAEVRNALEEALRGKQCNS